MCEIFHSERQKHKNHHHDNDNLVNFNFNTPQNMIRFGGTTTARIDSTAECSLNKIFLKRNVTTMMRMTAQEIVDLSELK